MINTVYIEILVGIERKRETLRRRDGSGASRARALCFLAVFLRSIWAFFLRRKNQRNKGMAKNEAAYTYKSSSDLSINAIAIIIIIIIGHTTGHYLHHHQSYKYSSFSWTSSLHQLIIICLVIIIRPTSLHLSSHQHH